MRPNTYAPAPTPSLHPESVPSAHNGTAPSPKGSHSPKSKPEQAEHRVLTSPLAKAGKRAVFDQTLSHGLACRTSAWPQPRSCLLYESALGESALRAGLTVKASAFCELQKRIRIWRKCSKTLRADWRWALTKRQQRRRFFRSEHGTCTRLARGPSAIRRPCHGTSPVAIADRPGRVSAGGRRFQCSRGCR